MDILYRLRDDRLTTLYIWCDDGSTLQERVQKFDLLRKVVLGPPRIAQVIDRAEKSGSSPIIDSLTLVKLQRWSKGRVLLLGDSAHGPTLLSGQGARMGLASAEILGEELIATEDVAQACASHEKKLQPTIERLQDRSKRLAFPYIPKNAFVYYLGNLLMRVLPYSWIVSWHSSGAEMDLIEEGEGRTKKQ
jgi:2-polyprenyl-6-methoxyphenol hydroxylase-like FAD-dependent oxidoreductase